MRRHSSSSTYWRGSGRSTSLKSNACDGTRLTTANSGVARMSRRVWQGPYRGQLSVRPYATMRYTAGTSRIAPLGVRLWDYACDLGQVTAPSLRQGAGLVADTHKLSREPSGGRCT